MYYIGSVKLSTKIAFMHVLERAICEFQQSGTVPFTYIRNGGVSQAILR